jgi:hypothetical protein
VDQSDRDFRAGSASIFSSVWPRSEVCGNHLIPDTPAAARGHRQSGITSCSALNLRQAIPILSAYLSNRGVSCVLALPWKPLRLYASDWAAFVTWCRLAGATTLPATPAIVATYLTTLGERLSAGALARCAAAIAARHRSHGLASPASDPAVTTLLRHARRTATQWRALPPTGTRLTRMATACPADLAGLRDRAMLLLAATGLDWL